MVTERLLMPNNDGMVPLHHALCNSAPLDIIMALVDAAPESATILDNWGRTPLQLLMPLAKLKGENGMLPLHFQAAHSKTLTASSVKFWIAAYPDSIDVLDDRGMLPVQYACINKSLCVDALMYFVEMQFQRL
jgi:ankyrin repeat protein